MDTTTIFVTLGVATISAAAALAGIWIGGRTEKAKWLREQRREAFIALLDHGLTGAASKKSADLVDARSAVNRIRVLGPEEITEVADELYRHAERSNSEPLDRHGQLTASGEQAIARYHALEATFAAQARDVLN